MNVQSWKCQKIYDLFDSKRVEWFPDNFTLAELQILKGRLMQCSPSAYNKLAGIFQYVERKLIHNK